jgi:transposase
VYDQPCYLHISPYQKRHQPLTPDRRLELCLELRATTLLREVRELGYGGSYPLFARRVRALRPGGDSVDPPLRFETGPGLQAQGDWAHCGPWLLGEGLVELHALVVVLGCSRMVAVRFATEPPGPRRCSCCPGSCTTWTLLPRRCPRCC